jgi:hypothetical protein
MNMTFANLEFVMIYIMVLIWKLPNISTTTQLSSDSDSLPSAAPLNLVYMNNLVKHSTSKHILLSS